MIRLLVLLFLALPPALPQSALVQDRSHPSYVFNEDRNYRVFLPPGYADSSLRYPVVYWFHGWSGRHNKPEGEGPSYDEGIAQYVATHMLIVVKADGFNPRSVNDKDYKRPYNVGPVETHRQFPHYFPELVEYIDSHYRTAADRTRRGIAGYSMGGFMALWIAGKHPSLVSSVTANMPSTEFVVGLRGLDTEYRHEEMWNIYDGVRVRLVLGKQDFIRSYHRNLLDVWKTALPDLDVEEFDVPHSVPSIDRTLDFHLRAFTNPPPAPEVWSHSDVFPNFSKWDWDVASDRRVPGFTVIRNASKSGFRSVVREWIPSGVVMKEVKLSVTTAPYFRPNVAQTVSLLRVSDGAVTKSQIKADADGRLTIEVPGAEHEIAIGPAAQPAMDDLHFGTGYWAEIGKPVKMGVKVWNKGLVRMPASKIEWKGKGLTVATPQAIVPALAPGASANILVDFTPAAGQTFARIDAAWNGRTFSFGVPLYPPAELTRDARIADGKAFPSFVRAVEKEELVFGEGNADGRAELKESFAVMLPEGDSYRPAELITSDACLDTSARVSDRWQDWDHVGGTAKYTLARFSDQCRSGRIVRALARIQVPADKPKHIFKYAIVEIPVP